jgi:hypothetical protein
MQKLDNVFTLDQNVLIMIFAQSTNATMEFVIFLKRKTVMMEMLALLILAVQLWDANTLLLFALMQILAQLIVVIT